MLHFRDLGYVVCCAAVDLACSGQVTATLDDPGVASASAALRDMTAVEASEDLEQLFTYVRTFYGPYEYKEARFGYSIAELEDEARSMLAGTPTDDGFYAAANWFLSRFDDGHVGLQPAPDSNPVLGYQIGIFVQAVEGKALVAELLEPSLADIGVAYGDEVIAVDGVSPFALVDSEIRKFESSGNALTNQNLIYRAFIRPAFAANIRPVSPTAHVDFRRADGSEYSRDLIWRAAHDNPVSFVGIPEAMTALPQDSFISYRALEIGAYARSALAKLGAPTPFFLTPATAAAFEITPVTPNPSMLAKYGLNPNALPDIFAALYAYADKTILLIRQGQYTGVDEADRSAQLQYYRAIMDQFDPFVDGLVVDQTHNPGGSLSYCTEFARLFASTPGYNWVQAYNTDRKWVNQFRSLARSLDPSLSTEESQSVELLAARIEAAYDAGMGITSPMPISRGNELRPDETYVWSKPRIVLIDELACSCADVFPLLVKRNNLAPLFGRRTMGLGGSVESFGPLANSQASVRLTRSLLTTYQSDETYEPEDFLENSGVQPDVEHVITVNDFRSGFVEYMTHFSKALVSQIDGAESP